MHVRVFFFFFLELVKGYWDWEEGGMWWGHYVTVDESWSISEDVFWTWRCCYWCSFLLTCIGLKSPFVKLAVFPLLSSCGLSSSKWFAIVLSLLPIVEQYFKYLLGLWLYASVVSSHYWLILIIFYCYIDSKCALACGGSDSSANFGYPHTSL